METYIPLGCGNWSFFLLVGLAPSFSWLEIDPVCEPWYQKNEFTGEPREEHQNRMKNEQGHDVLDSLECHKKRDLRFKSSFSLASHVGQRNLCKSQQPASLFTQRAPSPSPQSAPPLASPCSQTAPSVLSSAPSLRPPPIQRAPEHPQWVDCFGFIPSSAVRPFVLLQCCLAIRWDAKVGWISTRRPSITLIFQTLNQTP